MDGHQEPGLEDALLADRKRFERDALNQIRKQSLDPFNRLRSIAEDIDFVQTIHEKYSTYPLLANLRCGAWYCKPHTVNGIAAHFKSADGHYNGWSFNLRRPNLHILPLIRESYGICLVDSTRSGKRLPDSLSKTVPIWCSVVNRAMKLRRTSQPDNWDVQLYTPPQSVSKQEHSQVESRLEQWASSLVRSSYNLPELSKPLRPIWITPATTTSPKFDEATPFFPIICISASKMVEEGTERRRQGYSYVQGAGDDHENWSAGLTPVIFWRHKDELLNATERDFPDVLRRVVSEGTSHSTSERSGRPPTPVAHVGGLLAITALGDMLGSAINPLENDEQSGKSVVYIIVRAHPAGTESPSSDNFDLEKHLFEIAIPNDKKSGERAFKSCLPGCLVFIRHHLREHRRVYVACKTGTDVSVAIVLVALQAFFNGDGDLDLDQYDRKVFEVTKDTLRSRLHWIIASRPEANPSRATLKRVNEFFMSPLLNGR